MQLLKLIYIAIVLLTTSLAFAQPKVNAIEPPNWWVGLNYDTVQIMFYGTGLSNASITTTNKDIKIVSTLCSNSLYAFANVVLNKSCKAVTVNFNITTAQGIETVQYNLDAKPSYTPNTFGTQDLIYLIMPDRFSNGDTSNDYVTAMEPTNRAKIDGRHGGDIQGITNHLDYIKELGVTTIWLTPFQEMNDATGSYHGYGTSNFYQADARYTTGSRNNSAANNAVYKNFVQQSHNKGLKVIMDVVLNHIGDKHPWRINSPRLQNWVHEDSVKCNFEMSTLTDPYASLQDAYSMEKGWFVPSMPDLNQSNPMVTKYLTQYTLWWIAYAGLDGIRLDTAPFSEKNSLSYWAKSVRNVYPNINLVGEVWSNYNVPNVTKYWQANNNNEDGYNSHIPCIMDFPLWENTIQAFVNNDPYKIYFILGQDYIYTNPFNKIIVLDNHDMARVNTALNNNWDKYKQAHIFLATTRGIPQIYYGSEVAYNGPKGINDGYMRMDMMGGWPTDNQSIFNGNNITSKDTTYMAHQFNKNLWNWRKTNNIIHTGKLMQYTPKDGIYAYARYKNNKVILVILNFSDKQKNINVADYNIAIGYKKCTSFNVQSGNKNNVSTNLFPLEPQGYYILELEK